MYFNMSVWQASQNVSWCIIELWSDRVRLKAFSRWASTNSEADTHWKGRGLRSRNKPSRATMKSTWSWLDIVDLNATIATLSSLQPCQSKKRMGVDSSFCHSQKQSVIWYIQAWFNLWHFLHTLIFEPFPENNMHTSASILTFLPAWMNQLSTNGKSMKEPVPFRLYWQKERKKKSPLSTLTTKLAWWKSDHHFSLYHSAPLGKNSFYTTHYQANCFTMRRTLHGNWTLVIR